jgi:act minimal PKS acyl carrier protein
MRPLETPLTVDDLLLLLHECAGTDESAGPADPDTPFELLGYDSLALLEVAGRLDQDLGVDLPDEVVAELRTPRQFVDAVNAAAPAEAP